MRVSRLGIMGFTLASAMALVTPTHAEFPEEPIQVIVPFGAGGLSDTFARIIQKGLDRELDQPVVIVNVPGAGGTIGSRQAKDADADGYTILNLHDGLLTASALGVTDYANDAFVPIAQTGSTSAMVVVGKDSPYQTLNELMDAACAAPNTIKDATNIGAIVHFTTLFLSDLSGCAEFRFVQAGGGSKRMASILGGHADVAVFATTEYADFDDSVRALAILSAERNDRFPDVPTAKEQGYDAEFGVDVWWFAPAGTPQERVDYLADKFEAVMNSEDVLAEYEARTMKPVFMRGEALANDIEAQRVSLTALAEKFGLGE